MVDFTAIGTNLLKEMEYYRQTVDDATAQLEYDQREIASLRAKRDALMQTVKGHDDMVPQINTFATDTHAKFEEFNKKLKLAHDATMEVAPMAVDDQHAQQFVQQARKRGHAQSHT